MTTPLQQPESPTGSTTPEDTVDTDDTVEAVDPDVDGLVLPAEADPETPWAMQVALRYDKADLPTEDAVCEVTARAVVLFLTDPRTVDGPWAALTSHWVDGRIRKLVRRARGIRWENVQRVPGITVEEGSAAARVLVPQPARPLRKEVDDLQVSGTSFPAGEGISTGGELVTVGISPLVEMTSGKAAAQCGHAAQLAWYELAEHDPELAQRWLADDARVRVVRPTAAEWAALDDAPVHVVDAGFTELDGPTETTRAWW